MTDDFQTEYRKLDAKLTQFKNYFEKHFDIEQIFEVIDPESFPTREFGFERGEVVLSKDDEGTQIARLNFQFIRNKSFREPEELQEYLEIFPIAGAYIGALYQDPLSSGSRSRTSVSIHDTPWKGRELIFDLDLNEYDPVRTCGCKGRDYCTICWGLLQDAAVIMNETLQEDFGFERLKWVFTGGRGYHCWVLDEELFDISQEQRSGIVHYMQLINDPLGEQRVEPIGSDATILRERIYATLMEKFVQQAPVSVFKEINIGKAALATLRKKVEAKNFQNHVELIPSKVGEEPFLEQLIKYYYPRIDHKVTIDTRRLIRMPGSVHGRTGLISQYLESPQTFYPDQAKHIDDLIPIES